MFGVPDARYGEEVCAWIVLKAGQHRDAPRRSRAFCRGQIAHYKVPRHIRFVPRVPAHRHRQGAEVRDARSDDARARVCSEAKTALTGPRELVA